jgi:dolichol kinase
MREKFRKELIRKLFHLTGVTVPLVYVLLGKNYAIFYTSSLLLASIFLEFIRIRAHVLFPLNKLADMISRHFEKTAVASYVYFCMAALIVVFFMSENAVIVGLTAALLGDAISAVVGVGVGKHQVKNKTLEGSASGLTTVVVISYLLSKELVISIMLGLVFMALDIINVGFDDNFVLPVGMSGILYLLEGFL